ncbi:MAG: hypothetical protein JXA95_06495 [Spirochaetales bacterium]|nr:hypothetical protein [Spirochaetales bacterium]
MKKLIDRICKSRLARSNRGCRTIGRHLKNGWLFGIRRKSMSVDVYTAEFLEFQRFRNM